MAEACVARGWEVHGTIRGFRSDLDNLNAIDVDPKLHTCDLTDHAPIARIIRTVKPDYIFHLAAQSYVPDSWNAPRQTMDANIIGTLNVLEAIRHEHPSAAFHFAGTSEEYGMVRPEDCPITEDTPLCPLSPYGVSKVAGDLLTRQYVASYGIRAVVTRAFNHSGPRRNRVFAESDWCRQAVMAEIDLGPAEIVHGNLDAIRDYTDVRDIVKGYILAIEKGESGRVYQLASGIGRKMQEVLDTIIRECRVPVTAREDSKRMRPSDVPRLIGSPERAHSELGWKAEIDFGTTIRDLLDYWRDYFENHSPVVKQPAKKMMFLHPA